MSRGTWIDVFLFLHVLGAIVAVGPTLTYALWARLGEKHGPREQAFAIKGINFVDSHMATPAFMVQALTGIALILLLEISFLHTAWLLVGVGLYVLVTILAVALLAPVEKRLETLVEQVAADPANERVRADKDEAVRRVRSLGSLAGVLTVAIVFFMVVKPALWSAG